MKFKDYYKVLGLPRDATQDAIKSAYRKLARKYHPDVSKLADAETRFKELGEAYGLGFLKAYWILLASLRRNGVSKGTRYVVHDWLGDCHTIWTSTHQVWRLHSICSMN